MISYQNVSIDVWSTKYRLKNKNREFVESTIEDTFIRVSNALAELEFKDKEYWKQQFLDAMNMGCIPAGRILANAGAGEHKTSVSTINCTVSGTIEDSMEDILDKLREAGITLKYGCGIGYEFSTLRPKGFLVMSNQACFVGSTKIYDINFNQVSLSEIKNKLLRNEDVFTFSCSPEGKIEVSKILKCWVTKKSSHLIRVTLDSGEYELCTPDHKFMTRDGSYKEAQELVSGDSLMPIYWKVEDSRRLVRQNHEPYKLSWEVIDRNLPEFRGMLVSSDNHAVANVEHVTLDEEVELFDIEVDSCYHNFPLASGVFVHNCTNGPLAFMDIFDKMCFTVASAGGRRGAQMCFGDNNEVLTNEGWLSIVSVCNRVINGENIYQISPDDSKHLIVNPVVIENSELYLVELDDGSRIEVTMNHKFVVRNDLTGQEYLKRLKDIDTDNESVCVLLDLDTSLYRKEIEEIRKRDGRILVKNYIKERPEISKYIDKLCLDQDELSSYSELERAWIAIDFILNDRVGIPKCPICGEYLKYSLSDHRFQVVHGGECASRHQSIVATRFHHDDRYLESRSLRNKHISESMTRNPNNNSIKNGVWNKGVYGKAYLQHFDKKDGSNSLLESMNGGGFIRTSELETFFEDKVLKRLGVPYEKSIFVNYKQYDFLIKTPLFNLVIETDGEYFHRSSKFSYYFSMEEIKDVREFDSYKDSIINSRSNWFIVRIWESTIYEDYEVIFDSLKKLISGVFEIEDFVEYFKNTYNSIA